MIRWGSFITTPDGEVDPARLKSTTAVFLGLLGGIVVVSAGVVEMCCRDVPSNALLITVGALVLPLTGGVFGVALRGKPSAAIPPEPGS